MAEPDDQDRAQPESHDPRRDPRHDPRHDDRAERAAAAARIQQQASWVDLQVRQAMERGEFDNLPGQGKPIEGLGAEHDPDWWLKQLVAREQIALLPPALALRKEDAELDDLLDSFNVESEVRRELEEFNARVRKAMYSPPAGPSGPPLITSQRDVEAEVAAWSERRTALLEAQRAQRAANPPAPERRRWWQRPR